MMNREQAINIIDQAISQVQTSRQGHELLAKALRVLSHSEASEKDEKQNKNELIN